MKTGQNQQNRDRDGEREDEWETGVKELEMNSICVIGWGGSGIERDERTERKGQVLQQAEAKGRKDEIRGNR